MFWNAASFIIRIGSMSTTGTEMLVETSVMDTMENTVETTVKPSADSTTLKL